MNKCPVSRKGSGVVFGKPLSLWFLVARKRLPTPLPSPWRFRALVGIWRCAHIPYNGLPRRLAGEPIIRYA
jgi:hypothetical protein